MGKKYTTDECAGIEIYVKDTKQTQNWRHELRKRKIIFDDFVVWNCQIQRTIQKHEAEALKGGTREECLRKINGGPFDLRAFSRMRSGPILTRAPIQSPGRYYHRSPDRVWDEGA